MKKEKIIQVISHGNLLVYLTDNGRVIGNVVSSSHKDMNGYPIMYLSDITPDLKTIKK